MTLRNNAVVRAVFGHRPLLVGTTASLTVTLLTIGGLLFDDRVLTGAPIWLKPFKFGVSIAIYAATLAWLISYVQRSRRLAWWVGTIFSVMLLGELAAITTQVVRGTTSHFNYATALDGGIWTSMAVMIVVAWVSNLILAVVLLRERISDRPMASALRGGLGIALIGMAVAFLMTTPSIGVVPLPDDESGIVGAHSVGVADGGPGLPVVGWSTVGGDLRVSHFIGIHALQAIPLFLLALVTLSGRFAKLRSDAVRVNLVRTVALAYLGLVLLTAWQAARGQSLIHPDAATLLAAGILLLATGAGVAVTLLRGRTNAAVATAS
ncbi:hypothetical protein [Flindersiella endophytica]